MIHINKKKYLTLIGTTLLLIIFTILIIPKENSVEKTSKLHATVINSNTANLTVQDSDNIIYTFSVEKNDYKAGDNLIIEYTGLLNKEIENQTNKLVNITPVSQDEEDIMPRSSNNLFSDFDILASNKLKEMTLEEKIGQILLVRYPEENVEEAISEYKVGGFIFFEDNFESKTLKEVQNMINNVQSMSKIPLLTAVDEEGGTVVRVSSNPNIISEPFASPRELYLEGGFDLIATDTKQKSALLESLGLNLNLAPVIDVSTNQTDYIYERTLGEDTELTSEYARTVIEANTGSSVSYVLKHFPGYGNNEDTHLGEVIDTRPKEEILSRDLPPFEAGIDAGAEAILVSHNLVQSMDSSNPASLSPSVHNILRNNLGFSGIVITDDLAMAAVSSIDNVTVRALLAGNDIIITTDYKQSFANIKNAVDDGTISETLIDNVVQRIISWKYAKGLMYEQTK